MPTKFSDLIINNKIKTIDESSHIIGLYPKSGGTGYDNCVVPSDSIISKIEAYDNTAVHKLGNETIIGEKTFNNDITVTKSNPNLILQESDVTKGISPSTDSHAYIGKVCDKNGVSDSNILSSIDSVYKITGENELNLKVYKPSSDSSESNGIKLSYDSNGNFSATIIDDVPYTNSSKQIATTNMVHELSDIQKTNCITEIPQDIIMTFDGTTLTTAVGSSSYIPNGDGVFDKITTDITSTRSKCSGIDEVCDVFLFLDYTGGHYTQSGFAKVKKCYSGPSAPTVTGVGPFYWYDIPNDLIKCTYDNGSTWINTNWSLPVAVVSCDASGNITALKRVFNGFSYFGSCVFVLPGVKALVPEGRNTDGTLKSTPCSISSVRVYPFGNGTHCILLAKNGNIVSGNNFYYDVSLSTLSSSDCVYLSDKNEVWRYGSSGLYMPNAALAIVANVESGAITSFEPKYSFHALDWNDKNTIVGWGMPDYSSGVSKSISSAWTVETDGWVSFWGQVLNNYTPYYVYVNGTEVVCMGISIECQSGMSSVFPVRKNDIITSTFPANASHSMIFYPCKGV